MRLCDRAAPMRRLLAQVGRFCASQAEGNAAGCAAKARSPLPARPWRRGWGAFSRYWNGQMRHDALKSTLAAGGLAGLAAVLLPAALALAEGENTWPKWPGSAYAASHDDPTDREFIKAWEATPPKGYPTLSPNNIFPMKAAIIRYTQIAARGGWQALPDMPLQQGSTDPAVAVLAEHLLLTGYLKERGSNPESFDYFLSKAVRRYQASNGLAPTGIVDKRTLAALNVP